MNKPENPNMNSQRSLNLCDFLKNLMTWYKAFFFMILKPYKLILKMVLIGLNMDLVYTVFSLENESKYFKTKVQPN